MEIQVHHAQGVYVITLSGRWDTFSASAFEQKGAELVAEGMRSAVIDAAQVDYVSSFGLRSLLNLGKLLEPLKGRIHMSALQPQVAKIFIGSGFGSLFPVFPTVTAAIKAFGKPE